MEASDEQIFSEIGPQGVPGGEYVSILNNRMERVVRAAKYRDPYFSHLYHLTIEKIRKFYHKINGLPELQTSKVFRVYTDEAYRKSFYKENIPEPEFVRMYLDAICDDESDIPDRLLKLQTLYDYAKRNVPLDEKDYRIHIKSRNEVPKRADI